MNKLNTLFSESTINAINNSKPEMVSKSEYSRAAINIGLSMIYAANESMTDMELYNYIINSQAISEDLDPLKINREVK